MRYSEENLEYLHRSLNRKIASLCRFVIMLLGVITILSSTRYFEISPIIFISIGIYALSLFIPTICYNFLNLSGNKTRYFLLTVISLTSGCLYGVLSYHVMIILVLPIVISCLYCEPKCTVYTYLIGLVSTIVGIFLSRKLLIIHQEPLEETWRFIVYGIVLRTLEYTAISIVCIDITIKIRNLLNRLIEKNRQFAKEQGIVVLTLAEFVESLNHETGEHVKKVGEYTEILCKALGFSPEELRKAKCAAMMHDIGKIMIPREILEKTGSLTEQEYEIMKKHVVYGKQLLENSPDEMLRLSATVAYEHHEHYDGKGYIGLKGEEINIISRCVAIADVFDALVRKRSYKKSWTPEMAKEEIIAKSGTQFDPFLVDLFVLRFSEFSAASQYGYGEEESLEKVNQIDG
ncbi:MAG: HD-GYP domain-containing protein [Spirochaetales bacterium]|nr:HD-GYP domain-containing protein [Spirochaetales bacterium]